MHLVTLLDWKSELIGEVIDNAIKVKGNQAKYADALKNKSLCMLFQKTSTRTRVSFEAGMTQLGGHAIFLDWRTTNFTLGDLKDEIRCLDRYCDIIMARVYKHADIKAMADASRVPVINALCDLYHPCQILADLMTIKEKKGKLEGLKLAFVGDGNNVCNSLIIGGSKMGMRVAVATPKGYEPHESAVAVGEKYGKYEHFNKPEDAVKGADVVYTDTWVSMGQEEEKEKRLHDFKGYMVDAKLMAHAKKDALFMHCLPAHRGYEVADEVLDSKQSIVFDEAENRMHVQKAVMLNLLGVKV